MPLLAAMMVCPRETQEHRTAHAKEIESLVAQLANASFAVRQQAAKQLEEIGEPALRALHEAVRASMDPELRRRASELADAIMTGLSKGRELRRIEGPKYQNCSVVLSPDLRLALCCTHRLDEGRTIVLWDLTNGKEIRRFCGHTGPVLGLAFSSDSRRVLSTGFSRGDSTIQLWDVQTGQNLLTLKGHSGPVYRAMFSPDDKFAVSCSSDRTARLWDLATGQEKKKLVGHGANVFRASFSADGRRIISCSMDGTIRVWSTANGDQLACLEGHLGDVNAAVFSPDGRHILSGGGKTRLENKFIVTEDCTLRLWDLERKKCVREFGMHDNIVLGTRFLAGGKQALSNSRKLICVWDLTRYEQIAYYRPHCDITVYEVSPNGKQLFCAHTDNTVSVWALPD